MSDSDAVQVAFLRGVNVGGYNQLPMTALRALLADLGFSDVRTRIQSGNAVFQAPTNRPPADSGARIAGAIEAQHGFRPEVVVLDAATLKQILSDNPFAAAGAADGAKVHIGFLNAPAEEARTSQLAELATPDEAFHLTPLALYLHMPSGIGRSKLAARAERLLGVTMTLRNQRVASAVADLVHVRT